MPEGCPANFAALGMLGAGLVPLSAERGRLAGSPLSRHIALTFVTVEPT